MQRCPAHLVRGSHLGGGEFDVAGHFVFGRLLGAVQTQLVDTVHIHLAYRIYSLTVVTPLLATFRNVDDFYRDS